MITLSQTSFPFKASRRVLALSRAEFPPAARSVAQTGELDVGSFLGL